MKMLLLVGAVSMALCGSAFANPTAKFKCEGVEADGKGGFKKSEKGHTETDNEAACEAAKKAAK